MINNQYVIDAALLLPKDLNDRIIELSSSLVRDYPPRITLGDQCLPHISLFMGVFSAEYLETLYSKLITLSQEFSPIELEIERIDSEELSAKDKSLIIHGLSLKSSKPLIKLHEALIKVLSPYLDHSKVNKQMFSNPEEIDQEDTPWMFPYIENFIERSSYSKFKPHITIGDGLLKEGLPFQAQFTATYLALCQLGNFCTCRKILSKTELKK